MWPQLSALAERRLFLIAAALAVAQGAAGEERAPVCDNPAPAIAAVGVARNQEVAVAVRRLASLVEEERQRAGLASVAVGVVHDRTVLFAGGFGCAHLARRLPATPDTLYRIGSVTKLFEATALMQQRDAGRLALDDPVARSVPGISLLGPDGERVSPTWRQLASHTAGLPRNLRPGIGTVADLLHFLEREIALSVPGTRYAYSNLGFVVLGQALAQLAGEGYQSYVHGHLFEPLGMASSTYDPESVDPDRLAVGYLRVERSAAAWSGYAAGYRSPFMPSGAMLSTVNDMNRFLMAQFGAAPILSPRSIREMWQPVAPTGSSGDAAAIGWFTSRLGPYTVVRKDGGQPGFTAFVQIIPERRLGMVVFVNESPERVRASDFERLDGLILELLLPPITRASAAR
jgi:D-alanyl-D-alanine-carboxypeptidase/D-alanyl-D-alanine-endopeptidase